MDEISSEQKLKLIQLQNYIAKMPSLSTTVTKVLEVCNNPNTSPGDLNRVISLDPVLTGKVLKLINSAYYSMPGQITSLTRAIIMLGLNTVKNLALSTAILENLGSNETSRALSMDNFWTHSICVGVTARSMAAALGVSAAKRDEYFLTGLLHDLGKIPLTNRFPEDYRKTLELTSLKKPPLYKSEDTIFGIDHMEIGRMISEKWKLNDAMKESICYHHNPEAARDDNLYMVSIIALANAFANRFEIGSAGDIPPEDKIYLKLLKLVGLEHQIIEEIRQTVLVEIDKARIFLQINR